MPQIFNTDSDSGIGSVATSNAALIVRATYTNFGIGGTDLLTCTGTGVQLFFEDNGSLFSAGGGDALVATESISVTVNVGSSLIAGGNAITMQSAVLTLTNFGLIKSTSGSSAILGAGNGSSIDNYGEISATASGAAYVSSASASSTINNYGTFRANMAHNVLDLGSGVDVINNHGTIFGRIELSGGTDTIFNSGTMRAAVAIDGLTGGSGNKTITNTGFIGTTIIDNDAIILGGGNDVVTNFGSIYGTIHLGGGADVYRSQGGATISAAVYGEVGEDLLVGNDFAEILNGGSDGDALIGRGGDDTLSGGAGKDAMNGGAGDDTFSVDSQGDTISETAGQGNDAVQASANYTLTAGAEIEFLINNTVGGLTLTGNEFAQTVVGHLTASDTLAGGGGADVLNGQGGNDTYNLGAFSASIVDSAGTADFVTSTITRSLAAFASIERLTLLGVGNGTGNGLANIITGSAAANILDGGLGADTLLGNAGNDTLIGNLGKDTMTGGANNDIFRFAARTHSLVGANADVVTDFDDSGNDRIDVSALFGPAMTYRHNLAFTAAGQVRINDIAGADVLVEVNTVGAGGADFALRLTNTTLGSMAVSDFIL